MTCLAQQSEQSAFSGGIPMARGHSPLTMEECGDSEPNTRTLSKFTTNNYQSTPQSTTRAHALMLPSSCLDGSVTPVGPSLNPQYTGVPKAEQACGLLTRTQNDPTITTVWVRIILKLFFTFDPFKVTHEEIRSTLRCKTMWCY